MPISTTRVGLILGVLLTGASLLLSCGSSVRRSGDRTLVVFAAASTTNAVKEIASAFEASSGLRIYCNFASSSALARQILAGADADLFFSANLQWVEALQERGEVAQAVELVGNTLVAVVPKATQQAPEGPADLLSPRVRRISIGEPNSVPAGIYAKKALTALGLWDAVAPRLVFSFDVRQALAYVETREVDAGLVYATDAAISPDVRVAFSFDPALSGPIRYPLVLLKRSRPRARELFRFFSTPKATGILERYGFQPLQPPHDRQSGGN
ncbi:MAG: molybdate ABC transporter substrate-binding protein [Acidobacteriota bacterium]